jgi:hypothetical protein
LVKTTAVTLFLLAVFPASGMADGPDDADPADVFHVLGFKTLGASAGPGLPHADLKRHHVRKHKKRRVGVRLRGPRRRIATRSVQNVFRVQPQTPAYVSRVGQVEVARREIVVEATPDATTGQINHMLASVHGGVVAAVKGARLMLVGIPDPHRVRALKRIVGRVSRMPGVASAQLSVMAMPDDVPQRISTPPSRTQGKALSHLLASGVAAAWNARAAATAAAAPTVVIGDDFGNGPLSHHVNATYDRGRIDRPLPGLPGHDHGYHVTGIVFGDFANDGSSAGLVTGVFPLRGQLVPVDALNDSSLTADALKFTQAIDAVHGRVVLNTSLGFGGGLDDDSLRPMAVEWIDLIREKGLEGRVFHATSAGNDGANGGLARAGSVWSAAAVRDDLRDDNGTPVPRLQNTLSVENVRETADASGLACLNPTSNSGGSVAAPGKNVYSFDKRGRPLNLTGTSQASPVIAGVATYLWSIAPDLTPQQVKSAILANPAASAAGCARQAAPALNAYRAVLSLDQPGPPTPSGSSVRMAILDLNHDHQFTEADLQSFVGQVKRSRTAKLDWSRFDLNGDGFTGGSRTSAFDLDRTGSQRAGASVLGDVTLAGATFHETSASDEDVLCYYTYSALYTGDAKRREQLLDPQAECGIASDPAQVDENCTATTAFGKPATIMGTSGDDKIHGTAGDDVIVAGAGKDQIEGLEGNDRICGGSGDDQIRGGLERAESDEIEPGVRINSGDDLLDGGDGTDRVHGTGGDDRVFGGPGDEDAVLGGSPGSDFMDGGPGVEDSCFRAEIPIDPPGVDTFGPGCENKFGF